jgi:hypothetical protein
LLSGADSHAARGTVRHSCVVQCRRRQLDPTALATLAADCVDNVHNWASLLKKWLGSVRLGHPRVSTYINSLLEAGRAAPLPIVCLQIL